MGDAIVGPSASHAASALRSDLHRRAGKSGFIAFVTTFLRERPFRPIVTLRLQERTGGSVPGKLIYPFIWIGHRFLCQLAAIDLPLKTTIGPGLAIIHGWGLVITRGATIGRNVTLFHGVTIGQGDVIAEDGTRVTHYPVIEDDVWIGPNAAIVGRCRVGRGSRILANAVVVSDVPPRSMYGGNPGRIVRENCPPDVLNALRFDDGNCPDRD